MFCKLIEYSQLSPTARVRGKSLGLMLYQYILTPGNPRELQGTSRNSREHQRTPGIFRDSQGEFEEYMKNSKGHIGGPRDFPRSLSCTGFPGYPGWLGYLGYLGYF